MSLEITVINLKEHFKPSVKQMVKLLFTISLLHYNDLLL